ncbi:hypothetical protein A2363_04685 [Candidatus Gottesmanbacteria bacterium RIFOXYB1_FULL_47_11]|uniref:Uncharacterized protein n=1 Tax=Candidatus Gottesmanbacteria bacterium RIFOXYB1_FULL_47_11 TaxID=1798401 RepID=A0A1F6BFP4_9BACT|nr:MAG: hypothetical protein A2363_04685 [Candidatus Gottesmanbacteria bacterium RIFOXYB1_FULL_47_11]
MREIYCLVCNKSVGKTDLRASEGGDAFLLEASEQGQGFKVGINHLIAEHPDLVQLREAQNVSLVPLVRVGEYNPLDKGSRLPITSPVRRG